MIGTLLRKLIPNQDILARDAHHFLKPMSDPSKWSWRQWQDFWGDWRAQAVPPIQGAQFLRTLPPSTFALPAWDTFKVGIRGIEEVVRWPLYHYRAYAAAGATELLFFDQTEGSATNGRADTNQKMVGALPGGEMMIVSSIGMKIIPAQADISVAATVWDEWYDVIYTNAWAEFRVQDKEYMVIAPLDMIPSGSGVSGIFDTAATASFLQVGSPDKNCIYRVDPPIGIPPTVPFQGALKWRALQTVTTAARIGMILDGWKVRAVL